MLNCSGVPPSMIRFAQNLYMLALIDLNSLIVRKSLLKIKTLI